MRQRETRDMKETRERQRETRDSRDARETKRGDKERETKRGDKERQETQKTMGDETKRDKRHERDMSPLFERDELLRLCVSQEARETVWWRLETRDKRRPEDKRQGRLSRLSCL
jgi:hypothetical protein